MNKKLFQENPIWIDNISQIENLKIDYRGKQRISFNCKTCKKINTVQLRYFTGFHCTSCGIKYKRCKHLYEPKPIFIKNEFEAQELKNKNYNIYAQYITFNCENCKKSQNILLQYFLQRPKILCETCKRLDTYSKKTDIDYKFKYQKTLQTICQKYGDFKTYEKQRQKKVQKTRAKNYKNYKRYGLKHNKYVFENEYFDSSWELAFWIYCKDHNISIEHEPLYLTYTVNNKKHRYFPDFKIDNQLIEIKGDQFFDKNDNLRNPFNGKLCLEKQKCMKENQVKILRDAQMRTYLNYIKDNYGKNYLKTFKMEEKNV